MHFPFTYFEDEVRDGFYVPSIMKHAWAAQLEVLEDIDRVCKEYDITYFADCGTLLGAVRHNGFIPWDDDLDISMKREDYNKFLTVAGEKLPKGYRILNFHDNEEWDEMFMRVVNGMEISFKKPFLEKFHDYPFACGVDIFPIDFLPSDREEEEAVRDLIKIVLDIAGVLEKDNGLYQEVVEQQVHELEEMCQMKVDRSVSLRTGLFMMADRLCSIYMDQEATEVTLMPIWKDNPSYRTKKEYYQETIMLPFENTKIPVPAAYDAILQYRYGNYMKLVRNWETHDFLGSLKKQESVLWEKYGISLSKYAFCEEDMKHHAGNDFAKKSGKKEVVFLPYKASMWDSLEGVWREAIEDSNCDVYVIPIPYYEKDFYGNLKKMHYEGEEYPDYVPITKYCEFDFAKRNPDVIIIQNPYDEYNYATSVEPFFYARNLWQYTQMLVYIPYFCLDEIEPEDEPAIAAMDYFVTVPGVVCADKVIVQSEDMRNRYIDKLVKFAGEKTRSVWEKKILGIGFPSQDRAISANKDDLKFPEGWLSVLKKADGTWKKVILFHINVAAFVEYKERMLKKVQNVLQIFKNNCDEVAVLWEEDSMIETTLKTNFSQLLEEFQETVIQYREEAWGIYDRRSDVEKLFMLCDAYYGTESSLAFKFSQGGKPVMIQNVEVL